MITVEVEDNCRRCPYFEPEAVKLYQGDAVVEIVIRCADEQKCRMIEKIRRGG